VSALKVAAIYTWCPQSPVILDILKEGRKQSSTNLMLYPYSTLVMKLKIGPTYGRKTPKSGWFLGGAPL
jgi:hypothetical protein